MKELVAGMTVAVAAGLLMGAAMRPDFSEGGDRPGPQLFATVSADHPTGPFDDGAALASYTGKVPDYVYGTDWTKMDAAYAKAAPPLHEEPYVVDGPPAPSTELAVSTTSSDAAPPTVTYPSVDGGTVYAAEADVG